MAASSERDSPRLLPARPRVSNVGREPGPGAPSALTWVPGSSHSPSKTGVSEVVATTTTSAPRTACSADGAAVRPKRSANVLAFRGLQTLTSRNGRTCRSASRWLRAWTPAPRIASTDVSARQSGQRTFHRRDEIFHTQQATDGLLGEDQEAHDAGIIVGGHACLQGVALSGATC